MKYSILLLLSVTITYCNAPQQPSKPADEFTSIFNGQNLEDWSGDTTIWRVDNGVLTGEITADKPITHNSFLIWNGGSPADFELKAEYRITEDGNSGINYRSERIDSLPYALKGYQADIDGKDVYTGLNYEERGRTFLARRGEVAVIETGQSPRVVGSAGSSDSLKAVLKPGDWNEYHLKVTGNHLQHYINGVLMSDFTDNDILHRKFDGLLGLQVHTGPPMKVEFRKLRLKEVK